MGEWLEKTLGELTSYIAKGIPPKYVEETGSDTIRVLNQKCNRNYRISYSESRLHDNAAKKAPEDKMIRDFDVLINSTGTGTAGRVAQIWHVPEPTTLDGHMIEVHGFYSALKKDILDDLSFSAGIMKLDSTQMKSLVAFLNSHDGYHLDELQDLIYKAYDDFVKIYQRLIPALAMQYCKEDAFDLEVEGSTTSSFDSVKQFYLDVYEVLGNLLVIPVALNNIKYRADVNSMNPLEKNVSSLEDFIKLTKASRYHFCLDTEVYTDFLDVVVNAKLRNAIGHNDVEYDAVSQVITYIPNPKDRTKKKTEYLLEFENEAVHMFQALLGVSEYLYRLRELSLMYDGKIPLMVQERANWPKKIGRNDPCPCGSGKKYKFCHGKN